MADTPTQTVTFQAAKTNSAPPPLPYHIEQGLRGEVGTTRFPVALSGVSRFLLHLISVITFVGIIWILWPRPIGFLVAIGIAGISLSLSGLFHGIPYLDVRRGAWSDTNWRLMRLSFVLVWGALAVIDFFLVYYPPSLPIDTSFLRAAAPRPTDNKITILKENLRYASKGCFEEHLSHSCSWYKNLTARLEQAERAQSATAAEQRSTVEATAPDDADHYRNALVFAIAVLVSGAVAALATYGDAFSSETNNAIWREPHTGYSSGPVAPKPPEDPEAKIKRDGFARWLPKINTDSSGAISFDVVYGEYLKSFGDQFVKPPMYDRDGFKKAFKDATGKEPIDGKYQGVSLPATSIA